MPTWLLSPALWRGIGVLSVVLALVLFVSAVYQRGASNERARLTALHDATISKLQRGAAERIADAEARARNVEHKAQQDTAAIAAQQQEAIEHVRDETARTIADLRAGNVRLRHQCAATPADSSSVPDHPAPAGGSDATAAGGLRIEDAEFLIRFADEADEVVAQLGACQGMVASYQKHFGIDAR